MVSARDVSQDMLTKKIAEELKRRAEMPEWAKYVKTGLSRERPPEDRDWWYMRMASMLRKIYVEGPVGVSRMRSYYGGLQRKGHKPAHFAKASGKIIRVILQDLERLKLVENTTKPRKGRVITSEGKRFVDGVAKQIK
ncbi:MAG: 30S ribosomal protein S19e [Candidatus Aenigmarchaeota archaeon]|nr:30S ribosomal protein S19e [Candidatus Aenigmarchaeota archaeon]